MAYQAGSGKTGLTKEEIHARHQEIAASKPHGHTRHAGLKSGGGPHKKAAPPASRWPAEAKGWSGAKRKAYAAKLAARYPHEDPEYGMPDGSEK